VLHWEVDTEGTSQSNAVQKPVESRRYYGADERLVYFNQMRGFILTSGQGSGTFDEYRYDALGRRVLTRTRRPGTCAAPCDAFIERTVYDGDQVLAEVRSSGAAGTLAQFMEAEGGVSENGTSTGYTNPGYPYLYGIVLYAHGPGIDQPAHVAKQQSGSWATFTPHSAWRGEYAYGTTASGTVCTTASPTQCPTSWPGFRVNAYGREAGVTPAGYATWHGSLVRGRRDASGLTYLRNRYYDAATGRFTQEDPIGLAGGLNLYGYAGGDPINFSDPFGLCPEPGSEEYTGEVCFDGAAALGTVLFGSVGAARAAGGRLAGAFHHAQALRRVARESAFADGAPTAENGALQNTVDQLFRGADNVPGGTAGAVRMEAITGKAVGGKFHTQKAAQRIVNLQRILKREKLSEGDRATAQRLLDDLQGAMNTKP